ncbi:MAG: ribokinase [Candidatus Ratteibacteria bacterium]
MKILTIGSLNMDTLFITERLPKIGETVLSRSYSMNPGGKGANQAVAVSKLGAESLLAGRVGDDALGKRLLQKLKKEKVNVHHVLKDEEYPTGTAFITVDEKGNNTIVVSAGANMKCSIEDINNIEYLFQKVDMVLLQFEIPLKTILHILLLAEKYQVPVILDPAPAHKFPLNMLNRVYILSPNETETQSLIGIKVSSLETARKAAKIFIEKGVKNLVMKLGQHGALISSQGIPHCEHIKGIKVKAIDSTAAGDVFIGAMAVAYLRTGNLSQAVKYANYAGAFTVTKIGAQPSIPSKKELEAFIQHHS